jgi:DNA polymerase III subunit delta'
MNFAVVAGWGPDMARPNSTSSASTIGHEAVRMRLSEMKDRFPPSLIFAGPPGIGKKLVALEMARELTGDTRSLDLAQPVAQTDNIYFVQPDGASIKIEQAREAMHFLSLGREGRKLIFIFDEAQALGPQAANALLKSIEEPPPGVHFIFLVPSSSMLLSTIRSRSQVVRFAPLSDEEVVRVVASVDSSLKLEPWMLEMSMGSPGAALELARGQGEGESEIEVIQESLSQWLQAFDRREPESERLRALGGLKESLKERDHHQLAFRMLGRKLGEAWRTHANAKSASDLTETKMKRGTIPKWLRELEFERLESLTDLALECEADLARNVDRQLLWEQMSSRIVTLLRA